MLPDPPAVTLLGAQGLGKALPLPISPAFDVSKTLIKIYWCRVCLPDITEPAENGPAGIGALDSPMKPPRPLVRPRFDSLALRAASLANLACSFS